jgi:hypothetical protein
VTLSAFTPRVSEAGVGEASARLYCRLNDVDGGACSSIISRGGNLPNGERVKVSAIVAVVVLVIAGLVMYDRHAPREYIPCPEGKRTTIDLQQFRNTYYTYGAELDVSVRGKLQAKGKLTPVVLKQLGDQSERANQFMGFVVAGYNACAISAARYDDYTKRFASLNEFAAQISAEIAKDRPDEQIVKRLLDQMHAVDAAGDSK